MYNFSGWIGATKFFKEKSSKSPSLNISVHIQNHRSELPIYQMKFCGVTDLSTLVLAMTNKRPSMLCPLLTSTKLNLTILQGKIQEIYII